MKDMGCVNLFITIEDQDNFQEMEIQSMHYNITIT